MVRKCRICCKIIGDRGFRKTAWHQIEKTLKLHRRIAAKNACHERALHRHPIGAADRQVERPVRELCDLSEEDIEIAEEAAFG